MNGQRGFAKKLVSVVTVLSLFAFAGCKGEDKGAADSPDAKAKSEAAGKSNAQGQMEMYKKKAGGGQ